MTTLPLSVLPVGFDETIPTEIVRHDIYPGIDPTPYFENQTYQGKVVFITGASRGIGQQTAIFYARSGALLSLVARRKEGLQEVQAAILKEVPTSQVAIFVADVVDTEAIRAAVEGTVAKYGRLDVCIANAGKADVWDKPFSEGDPNDWWKSLEVNIRGTYNAVHFALPHLDKVNGHVIIVSSAAAQIRPPFGSAYNISKHALGRLNEYIASEHPQVKSFAIHPGTVPTAMKDTNPHLASLILETIELPAAVMLRLTSGKDDWLTGRFVDARWDLDELESKWKAKILEQNSLVSKLAIPQ